MNKGERSPVTLRNGKPLRFVFWGSLRPSADWDWAWVALGPPKRHPSVTQGPRLRGMEQVLCLQHRMKKGRVGVGNWVSPTRQEIGKSKFHRGLTQTDAEQE